MLRVDGHLQPSPESVLTSLLLLTVAVVAVAVAVAIAIAVVAIVVCRLAVSGGVSMVQYDSKCI